MRPQTVQITKILGDVRRGNPVAANQLLEAVYADLHGMARHLFAGERPDNTLQPTALVHEAYLRIFDGADVDWRDRTHFFAVAARQMRHILIDHGREFRAMKRGSGLKVVLDEALHVPQLDGHDFEEVNDLLNRLQKTDPQAARVVEMKFFSGMTDEEVASELRCSHSTVRRHWAFAKAWLIRQMTGLSQKG